jgi:hypothetical protein
MLADAVDRLAEQVSVPAEFQRLTWPDPFHPAPYGRLPGRRRRPGEASGNGTWLTRLADADRGVWRSG